MNQAHTTAPTISNYSSENFFSYKIRKFLDVFWPIEHHELPKFLSMAALMFCILFNQNIIRALKDSIIITQTAAETISFLKFWGVMPASVLVATLYVAMVNRMDGEKIFYIILSTFLIFFTFFTFVVVPNEAMFHFTDAETSGFIEQMPHLKWFIVLMSKWTFSLFYIIAELWPSTVFALLFWQFVNSVTSVSESRRFYVLFGLIAQTGLFFAGCLLDNLINLSNYTINLFALNAPTSVIYIQLAMSVVIFFILLAMYLFRFLNHNILHTKSLKLQVKKERLSIIESFKFAIGSRYIRLIAVLLICYGISINLVEGPWKNTVKLAYSQPEDYAAFVGRYLKYTGIFTVTFVIIGSNIVRKLGWYVAAMATPVMVIVTGLMFFIISNFNIDLTFMMGAYALTDPLMVAVLIGAIQNVLSKSTKYTLFDSTKEMSYVPLGDELKTKGKAAVDVIGVKLGKSASAFIQSMLFVIMPAATYQSISPFLMVVFIVICILWLWAVKELSTEYNKLIKNNEI